MGISQGKCNEPEHQRRQGEGQGAEAQISVVPKVDKCWL
jgi:hypothetical protein